MTSASSEEQSANSSSEANVNEDIIGRQLNDLHAIDPLNSTQHLDRKSKALSNMLFKCVETVPAYMDGHYTWGEDWGRLLISQAIAQGGAEQSSRTHPSKVLGLPAFSMIRFTL